MNKKARAERIASILDEHFPHPPVPLQLEDPFTLLIAVLLSAQCTDARVNQVTPALFALARTPEAMRHLPIETIRGIVRPCGLSPQKSTAISGLSAILVREHGGLVPNDLDALERLPGVGHKTASVVLAQAFGVPTFPIDTHIHRLAWRWGLSSGHSVERTERDLRRTFGKQHWNKLHLQIIHFGRAYCPAIQHVVTSCPICSFAMSASRQQQETKRRAAARGRRGGRSR